MTNKVYSITSKNRYHASRGYYILITVSKENNHHCLTIPDKTRYTISFFEWPKVQNGLFDK